MNMNMKYGPIGWQLVCRFAEQKDHDYEMTSLHIIQSYQD